MTSHAGRLYALGLALVIFFLAWATLAARPWSTAAPDPRLKALAARELRLRHDARLVNAIVARRWTAYRVALRERRAEIAAVRRHAAELVAAASAPAYTPAPAAAAAPTYSSAPASAPAPTRAPAPAVRIVTLPPLTITRTS